MSEDYKKIALEDVKVGQRVRIVEQYPSYKVIYEGVVARTDASHNTVDLGEKVGDGVTIFVDDMDDFYILLLEDAPKPKVVRTEKVTITHYDDGTKTETPVKGWWVPARIETMDQFEEHEDHLKQVVLKDRVGDYWMYRDGRWCFHSPTFSFLDDWNTTEGTSVIEQSLPMTIAENVGD